MPKAKLDSPSKYDRAPVAKGLCSRFASGEDGQSEEIPSKIDPAGGMYGAGLISGASIITSGEALGHGSWIDGVMLQQVADSINSSGGQGTKVRFAHPSLSGDGMGTFLGRAKNAFVVGDRVLSDIHLAAVASSSPDGDLAQYVLDLASEDPAAFGVSISFSHDWDSEDAFESQYTSDGVFKSPDPRNEGNLSHARLKRLYAADVVDEPAANPSGLFHANSPDEMFVGEQLLDFLSGRSETAPAALGVHPDRIKGLVDRYCERHGVTLFAAKPATEAVDERATLKTYIDAFGAEHGPQWYVDRVSFSDCQQRLIEQLRGQNTDLSNRIEAMQKRRGEPEPLSGGHAEDKPAASPESEKLKAHLGKNLGTFAASMKLVSRK